MIVSISRRTDIAAFYADWFINRVRAGFVKTRNPFNPHQVREISLRPEDVDCFVFWTRNPAPLFPYLNELENAGFPFYFHITITGYPRALEEKTPPLDLACQRFCTLSEHLGADRVIWRFDPVLLSSETPVSELIRLFDTIAQKLKGRTKKVMISLTDFYAKTERNLKKVEGLHYEDLATQPETTNQLLGAFRRIARDNGMTLQACAQEQDWTGLGITAGKCIDDDLIRLLRGQDLSWRKDRNQRKACGCVQSVDIGTYNSCLHGCQYCYATYNEQQAKAAYTRHDPNSAFLIERSAQKPRETRLTEKYSFNKDR